MVGNFLYAWLRTNADLTAICGTAISPGASDQVVTAPRVVYQVISDRPIANSLRGPGVMMAARVQVGCYAVGKVGYDQVQAMAEIIRGGPDNSGAPTGLDGYRGTLGGVTVQSAIYLDGRDDTREPRDASENFIQLFSMDFVFRYQR